MRDPFVLSIANELREFGLSFDAVSTESLAPLFQSASSSVSSVRLKLHFQGQVTELSLIAKALGNDTTESDFYRTVVKMTPGFPAPEYYGVACNPEDGQRYLLLRDLSPTHYKTDLDIPPTVPEVHSMVAALASLHGAWWGKRELELAAGAVPSRSSVSAAVDHVAAIFPSFCDRMGDRLSATRKRACEFLFDGRFSARISERVEHGDLTLTHRDSHSWNFLVPRDPNERAVLIDWHSHERLWRQWPGMSDVAYWIVHWWFPERRRDLEVDIVQGYVPLLAESGIDFDYDSAWRDYRLFAMWSLMRPIEESLTAPPWSWYPQFEYAIAAFDDLDCEALL